MILSSTTTGFSHMTIPLKPREEGTDTSMAYGSLQYSTMLWCVSFITGMALFPNPTKQAWLACLCQQTL